MPNPRNSRTRQPSPIRLPYVRFDAGYHLARIIDMTPAEAGDYFRRMLIALNTGQRGIMPEADAMMDEAQAYFDAKRRAGSTGGKQTQSRRASTASSTASSHTDIHTGIQAYRQIETQEREPGAAVAATLTQSQIEVPSLEVFRSFGVEQGMDAERVEKCFRHYEASGWRDTQGQPVRNWKAKLSSWMNRPELEASKPKRAEAKPAASGKEFSSTLNPRVIR